MYHVLQGLGEYGTLTGRSSADAATVIGTKITQLSVWASDHRTAVIVGVVVAGLVVWWATSPRS